MSASHDKEIVRLGEGVRSILRNGTYLLGAGWLGTALRAIYVVILARALGPQDYGLLSSAQAMYVMFVIGSTAGVATYVAREVAIGRADKREALWSSLAVEASFLVVGAAAFLLLTIFLYPENEALTVFLILALTLIARGIASWATQTFVICEASQYQLRLVSLFRTIEVLVAIAAIAAGGGLISVAAVHLVSWILEAATGLWIVHARLGAWFVQAFALKRLLSFARGLATVSAATSAGTWLRIAPLALYPYVAADAGEVGQFALAWNAMLVIATAVLTLMNAAIPVVSRAHARADEKDVYYVSFCIRYGILFGSASAIAGIGVGAWLIDAAVGENYAKAGALFVTSLWIIAPILVGHALDQTLFLRRRTGISLLFNLAALLVLFAAFKPALRAFGPDGAVLMVVAVMMIVTLLKIALLRPFFGIALGGATLRAVASAGAGLMAAIAIAENYPVLAAMVGLVVLAAGTFLTGTMFPQERRFLLKLIRTRKETGEEH